MNRGGKNAKLRFGGCDQGIFETKSIPPTGHLVLGRRAKVSQSAGKPAPASNKQQATQLVAGSLGEVPAEARNGEAAGIHEGVVDTRHFPSSPIFNDNELNEEA